MKSFEYCVPTRVVFGTDSLDKLPAQLEKCGPVALAHIKLLILALENKHADYPHQLLAGLMSATQDCQQATRAFAEKSSVSFHNQ